MSYVTVDEGQTATVRIETAPGATIAGQLMLEGDTTDVSAGSFAFSATPAGADAAPLSGSRSVRAEVRDDWTFSMTDLHGAIRIEPTRVPEGWFLKSAYVNGVNAVDEPAALTRGGAAPSSVTVTFASGAGSVSGSVLDDRRQPVSAFEVIAFASDPNRWFSRSPYVRRGGGSQDGSFTIGGLPPGDYLVIALERLDAGGEIGEWQSPDVLTRLSGAANRVRVGQGQTATVELRSRPGL
jgi:hypothetical protein